MSCIEQFYSIYKREPLEISFCPYRVCPLGAHSDHQFGKITGLAINQGVKIAYGAKKNGVIEMSSLQFEKRAQWHIHQVDEKPTRDWADYLRGATWALAQKYNLKVGLCGVVEGSLPIGGLSSSAAIIIAFLTALAGLNDICLEKQEIIDLALAAERDYVGVSVGKLDQSCEVLSKRNHLLYLDTLNDSYELIEQPADMKDYKIAVIFSGVERSLAGSKFNMRVDEAKSAAYALMSYSGMEYGKFDDAVLRSVPYSVFEAYKNRLPENWKKRAEHFYTEFHRVEKAAECWRQGDIEGFGKLCFESGRSSIENWETGSEELIAIYDIMTRTDGIYGGRFSGAGFKGCCMALIDPRYAESIERKITDEYLKRFPNMKGKYAFYLCDSADGRTMDETL